MNRRKWLWSSLLALPRVVVGMVSANSQVRSFTCPLTGEELHCPKCCPLSKSKQQSQEQPYICPITGIFDGTVFRCDRQVPRAALHLPDHG